MNENNEKQKIGVVMRNKNRFPNKFFIGDNQKYNKYLGESPEQKEFPYYWVDQFGKIICHCTCTLAVYQMNNCHIKCAVETAFKNYCITQNSL